MCYHWNRQKFRVIHARRNLVDDAFMRSVAEMVAYAFEDPQPPGQPHSSHLISPLSQTAIFSCINCYKPTYLY